MTLDSFYVFYCVFLATLVGELMDCYKGAILGLLDNFGSGLDLIDSIKLLLTWLDKRG